MWDKLQGKQGYTWKAIIPQVYMSVKTDKLQKGHCPIKLCREVHFLQF